MTSVSDSQGETEALRERLSRLSQASLRITGDLDLDAVLQGVADGARSLTGARASGLTVLDDLGELAEFITSGLSLQEHRLLLELSGGLQFFQHLSQLPQPLRVADFSTYTTALGLPEIGPPLGPVGGFLCAPIRLRDQRLGNLYLSAWEGSGFTQEDEDTLVLFASQAALAIANARRHREERRARAYLETLVDTAPVGVVVFNAGTGAPLSFNREAVRIVEGLGETKEGPEELLEGLSFRRADGREVSLGELSLAQALGSGETVRAEEILLQTPGGRRVAVLVNATPITAEEGGGLESVVVVLQDLAPFEELERQRSRFLDMVSRELRGPLVSIKGSAAAVLRATSLLDPAETRQFFGIIDAQADRLLDLIGDLLDAARVDAGRLEVSPEPTEASLLLERAVSAFQGGGGRDNLLIDLPLDLPRVLADRGRVAQVLGKLLDNAAKHSPESTAIRVSAEREGVHVVFTVADQGVGIAPERLPRLFGQLSHRDGDDGAGGVGPGLGLAVCRGIVEAHGGRIRAESAGLGLGSRFSFTLPASERPEGLLPRPPGQPTGRGRVRVRVLAVDGDPQGLRYLRESLVQGGYQVSATSDPQEALRLMEMERPHLALLELTPSGSDGLELMQAMQRIANVPVIFLSGYGRDQVMTRAFQLGAEDYIVKPFSPTELGARIQAALGRRAAPQRVEPPRPYVRGNLSIDFERRRVSLGGREVRLTAIQYDLLAELAANAGRVVTHQELLQRVWGPANPGGPKTIRTHLNRLRRRLGEDGENPTYVFAEPRVGYRMAAADATD